MIYGTLEHLEDYRGIHPRVMKGLELLRDTDFSHMADGRYDVEGDDLYFSLQSYDSQPEKDTLEAHKKYVDIQFVLTGREKFGVAPVESLGEPVEGRPEGDIWFYRGPFDSLPLCGKRFAAVWPGDAHAPAIAWEGKGEPCRKCVVKVRL